MAVKFVNCNLAKTEKQKGTRRRKYRKQNVKKVCIFQVQAYIFTNIISTISHINTSKELLKPCKWRNEDFGKFQKFFFPELCFSF